MVQVVFLLLLISPLACTRTEEAAFEFALIGDNPYRTENIPEFEVLVRDVNQHRDLAWVLHVGDVRGQSSSTCDDQTFQARFALFQRFQPPFILTPGDNDWYDCGDQAAGGYDPYERLEHVRRLFFANPRRTLGVRPIAVESQADDTDFREFVENALWVRANVVFSTIHLVETSRGPDAEGRDARRMDAALAWISRTFERAKALDSPAIFITTQANPWPVSGPRDRLKINCPDCLKPRAGLDRLYATLEKEALAFRRPVVLAVGDTHMFRVNKPLYSSATGQLVENFTCVVAFGNPQVHWVRIGVDPRQQAVFGFREEIVDTNIRR